MAWWNTRSTRDGPQKKQKSNVLEYTRKYRVTANVKKNEVLVCSEEMVNLITYEWQ